MDETRATRRRALLAAGSCLLLTREAAGHGGGDGGGGGGEGGGGGLPVGLDTPLIAGPPSWYAPPGVPPPELASGTAAGTIPLAPLPPRTAAEKAAWEAWISGLEATVWDGLQKVADHLSRLGSLSQYALNFVSGLVGTNTALTGSRAFAEAYAKALDTGASQVGAIRAGLVAGAIGAGLDILPGKAFSATDHLFKNARDAVNTMKQIGGLTPRGVSKLVPNTIGYVGTVAGIEKGKDIALPVVVDAVEQLADALGKAVPDQSPPTAGGWLPGHASPLPAAR